MLYNLVRIFKGKEMLMMTDTLPKVNGQLRKFKISQKGKINGGNRVAYKITESNVTEHYKRAPVDNRRWQ